MTKRLACMADIQREEFSASLQEVNVLARQAGLREYTTYSRVWEYPWLWLQIGSLNGRGWRLLETGSEESPFAWFLAAQGFRVTVSDISARHWGAWKWARKRTGLAVARRILDAQNLGVAAGSADIYLSISVIEHVPDKQKALLEAARVLRPGGFLALTFDICQPEMGMTFPAWNGKALTMEEFDGLIRGNPWFEPGVAELSWNTNAIPEYLAWHRQTAPHHNYVTAGAVLRRTGSPWPESPSQRVVRALQGQWSTARGALAWYGGGAPAAMRSRMRAVARAPVALATSAGMIRSVGEPLYRACGFRLRGRSEHLSSARSVLVLRPDEIGDVVMTSPFLRELRRNAPRAWITLVVKAATFNLVEHCPYVNETLVFEGRVEGAGRHVIPLRRAASLAFRRLWRRRFDLALLPRSDADFWHAGLLAYFSGARRRVGYSEKGYTFQWPGGAGYEKFLTCAMDVVPTMHEVERNLHLLRLLGGEVRDDHLELWLTREDRDFAARQIAANGAAPDELLVGIAPGAGRPNRAWPLERFIEVGQWLVQEFRARLVIVGGAEDGAAGAEFRRRLGAAVVDMTGKATLRQAAATLERCRLLVGNDSGPAHLAAAAGTATVVVSAHPRTGDPCHFNSPRRFGPWRAPGVVLQPREGRAPCRAACVAPEPHCILDVAVEEVREAAATLAPSPSSDYKAP